MSMKYGKSILETLTAALYSDPIVIFREYVQNAVDGNNAISRIPDDLEVKIDIDLKKGNITILDNGYGIPFDDFEKKMSSLGASEKSSDMIGFRGIGRLSGMSFCKKLEFKNKHKDSKKIQTFSWQNEAYRKCLEMDTESELETILPEITETKTEEWTRDNPEHFFQVSLFDISEELRRCICEQKHKGKKRKIEKLVEISSTFKNVLANILPIPYRDDFSYANRIKEEYNRTFGEQLSKQEFTIYLNNEKLNKPFYDSDIHDNNLFFIPLSLKGIEGDSKIGLLWLSFSYLFKAYSGNYGISVRNKNMLLSGENILANEASKSPHATTTHAQYLSAIKGVIGELLINTELLKDNSKRDWFKVDNYSLQLREIICQFVTNMHEYRYKASKYYNSIEKTEQQKNELIIAFKKFVMGEDIDKVFDVLDLRVENNTQESDIKKIIADELDLFDYNITQKRFYEKIMNVIYEYYDQNDRIENYYALKAYILKKLNEE